VVFGILATGSALGRPVAVSDALPGDASAAARRRLASKGYRRLFRAEDKVGITDLAAEAAEAALERTDVAPGRIDLLVVAISDLAEYLYWDVAAAVQARIGAHRAEAFLLNQACGAGVVAFDTVAGKFATHPGYRTALIVAANRVCETYWNRAETGTSISSDGAAAAVVRRDHGANRWRTTEILSDGRYADLMHMRLGGTAHPFAGAERPSIDGLIDRMDTFFGGDGQAAYRFAMTARARNRIVLERACDRVGLSLGEIARVIYLNDNTQAFTELSGELGIPLDRTNLEPAMDHGHLGAADQIFCLERHLAQGDLTSGDTVALMSMSSGMHWTCTLLTI
jgi:3-oxoacyl-[acyl-carrier-protein] synthase-3